MRVIENKKAIETHELDRFGPPARRNTLLLCSIGLYWLLYDMVCFWRGSLPALYSLGGKVTSQLDLGDNRKVITDYRNYGIICILTDLIVSSGYPPDILLKAPARVMPRKALSCGLGRPWGRSPCGLPWVSRVVPPTMFLLEIWLLAVSVLVFPFFFSFSH